MRWGTVTAVSPLRVKLDGDSAALGFAPDSLVDPAALAVDDRVRCELSNRRLVVVGRAGGASVASPDASTTVKGLVELATNGETATGTDAARAVTPAALDSHPGVARAIATGSYSSASNISTGSGVSVSQTFPSGLFTSAPRVVCVPTNSSRLQMAARSITTTGFAARLDNFSGNTASGRDFNWIAIQE